MSGNIESLARSLRATEGYVNDHDNICDCRPVDVRVALAEIENLRAENQRLREKCDRLLVAMHQIADLSAAWHWSQLRPEPEGEESDG